MRVLTNRRVGFALIVVLLLSVLLTPVAAASSAASTQHHGSVPSCGVYHRVQWGETLSGIAWRYGVSVRALMRANGITNPHYIYAGQRLAIPCGGPGPGPASPQYYTVRHGDTLYKIATRFGTTVRRLTQLNNIWNPHMIYPGWVLRIR